ncbi:16668_t:CDS:1, partial [Acaulospora colombiana]
LTTAKAFAKDIFINQERKLGDQRRLDNVVVLTINHANQGSDNVDFLMSRLAPYGKPKCLGNG